MKKLVFILSVLLSLNLLSFKVFAQPSSQLSISVVNFPDTAHVNQSYSFQFIVTNLDSSVFTGLVTANFRVDTFLGSFGGSQTGNLFQFDTLVIAVNNFTFDPNAQFRTGDNVVVVWPSISNEIAGDSLFLNVFIPDPNSIKEEKLYNELVIFPNPAKTLLTVSVNGSDNSVERVRIYSIDGQLIFEQQNSGVMNISQLPRGVYLLEVINEEKVYYKKLFKD